MSKRRSGSYLGGSTLIIVPRWRFEKNLKEGQERHRRWVRRQLEGLDKPAYSGRDRPKHGKRKGK
jgi:hypothetical protein